jgi:hypothetical protein
MVGSHSIVEMIIVKLLLILIIQEPWNCKDGGLRVTRAKFKVSLIILLMLEKEGITTGFSVRCSKRLTEFNILVIILMIISRTA